MPGTNEFGQQVGDNLDGWTPRPTPRHVTLTGRYVIVEPLSPDHAASLYEATCGQGDEPMWTYRPMEPPASVAAMATMIEQVQRPDSLTFAFRPEGGGAEGIASYQRIEPAMGQVEVAGILFARSMQRTRAATEAMHVLMGYAFDALGYRRYEWKCDSLNEPSRRAAERLGFRFEGVFRNHMVVKGRNRDTAWFSITDAEWPAVKAAHERWLDPANFGADGGQLTRLRVSPPDRSRP